MTYSMVIIGVGISWIIGMAASHYHPNPLTTSGLVMLGMAAGAFNQHRKHR